MVDMILRELADFLEPELGEEAASDVLRRARAHPAGDLRLLFAQLPGAPGDAEDLLRRFGRHLFPRLAALYPAVFDGLRTWRELLLQMAPRVHEELFKLQPDAEFPALECRALDGGAIEVEYRSPRNLGTLAEGMLLGCLDYFGTAGAVSREDLPVAAGYACRLIVQAEQA